MANALLFTVVVEDLHNGAGTGLAAIDRPIVRERKTRFPFVQSETLKGNFRAELKLRSIAKADAIKVLCGDDSPGGSQHRGYLEVGDAHLLALPVGSLRGGFIWATTPLILARLHRLWKLIDPTWCKASAVLDEVFEPREILCPVDSVAALQVGQMIFLEEYAFVPKESATLTSLARSLADRLFPDGGWWRDCFRRSLVVMHADRFRHFAENATEIRANIAINQEGELAGTTVTGSLRYTEYLPQETLLFGLAEEEAIPEELEAPLDGRAPIEILAELVRTPDLFQLGADETSGKGLVQFRLCRPEKSDG